MCKSVKVYQKKHSRFTESKNVITLFFCPKLPHPWDDLGRTCFMALSPQILNNIKKIFLCFRRSFFEQYINLPK